MPTMTETTVRVIGHCPTKECKNRRRHTVTGMVKRDLHNTRTEWGIPAPDGYGTVYPSPSSTHRPSRYPTPHRYDRAWLAAMHDAGWICTDHDEFMVLVVIRGVVNTAKPCSARCLAATGPSCECVCGGERHGSRWG